MVKEGEGVTTEERPAMIEEHFLIYLDSLRDSGITNMFGATPYLRRAFGLTSDEASNILLYWMRTYGDRHPQ